MLAIVQPIMGVAHWKPEVAIQPEEVTVRKALAGGTLDVIEDSDFHCYLRFFTY